MLYRMRQLENNTDQQTCNNSRNKKANHPGSYSHNIYRKCNKYESMYHFKNPEVEMIHETHFLQRHFSYAFSEILVVIKYENPEYIQHGVKGPKINVLVFMHLQSFLIAAHAHKRLNVDIIINTIDISIRMMNNIMFIMPD